MARTLQEIAQSMETNLRAVNKSIDLKVGPLYDYVVNPVATEIANVEATAERLWRYYSPDFSSVATPEEIAAYAVNFGLSASSGGYARATITFYRNSAPPAGSSFTAEVGFLVSTQEVTLIFQVVESAKMYGDYANTYYNPQTNRYEITAVVEATSPGIKYNLPAARITKLVTQGTGFDGIDQPYAAFGGSDHEDSSSLAERVVQKFKGLDYNSVSGITSFVQNYLPSQAVYGVKIVKPTDRKEFRRPTTKPSIDIYVKGNQAFQFAEEYIAFGGEVTIPITENRTAYSITSVAVNDIELDASEWFFIEDTSPEYQKSPRANSVVELLTPLTSNDVVLIVGNRNNLLDSLQAAYIPTENSLFEVDILIRSLIDLPVVVIAEIKVASNSNLSVLEAQINQDIKTIIEPTTTHYDKLTPDNFVNTLRSWYIEIESIKLIEFRRLYESIDSIETIIPLKNQLPVYNATASNIVVKV
jgi:hypothetical protein